MECFLKVSFTRRCDKKVNFSFNCFRIWKQFNISFMNFNYTTYKQFTVDWPRARVLCSDNALRWWWGSPFHMAHQGKEASLYSSDLFCWNNLKFIIRPYLFFSLSLPILLSVKLNISMWSSFLWKYQWGFIGWDFDNKSTLIYTWVPKSKKSYENVGDKSEGGAEGEENGFVFILSWKALLFTYFLNVNSFIHLFTESINMFDN